jgi:predicted DNA-binding protein YlxM (UPF0122 family)
MNDKFLMNTLLDFYGALLTEKQQEICRFYYREDLSLQEIAEIEGVSRAAVHDTVKRCRTDLEHYEELLHLSEGFQKRSKLYQQMLACTSDIQLRDLIERCIDAETEGGKNV